MGVVVWRGEEEIDGESKHGQLLNWIQLWRGQKRNKRTECRSLSSLLREADMIFLRMEEGASKWAFLSFRRDCEISIANPNWKIDVSFDAQN